MVTLIPVLAPLMPLRTYELPFYLTSVIISDSTVQYSTVQVQGSWKEECECEGRWIVDMILCNWTYGLGLFGGDIGSKRMTSVKNGKEDDGVYFRCTPKMYQQTPVEPGVSKLNRDWGWMEAK